MTKATVAMIDQGGNSSLKTLATTSNSDSHVAAIDNLSDSVKTSLLSSHNSSSSSSSRCGETISATTLISTWKKVRLRLRLRFRLQHIMTTEMTQRMRRWRMPLPSNHNKKIPRRVRRGMG
jgi:hypothetical protein